jgi:HlyD family secretion protein
VASTKPVTIDLGAPLARKAGTAPVDSNANPTTTPGQAAATTARRQRRRRWTILGGAVLVVLAATGAWLYFGRATPVKYATAPVTRGDVTKTVTASGTVNPETTVQVGSYVSGSIQSVSCDFNTQVKKGQVCAKIDPRPYQSEIDQDRANLSAAQAQLQKDQTNLTLQQRNFGRAQSLFDRQLISQNDLDAAKAAYEQAQSQIQVDQSGVTQRQAALASAQVNLGYTNIVSPVDGTVISRNVTVGQTVAASFQTPTLFLIATDLTKMQVDANISEGDIGGIRTAETAQFTVEAFPGRRFDGTVSQVRQAPEAVQNVVTYDVVITAANQELLLKPGMTANVTIVVDRRSHVLEVPDQALRYTPESARAEAKPSATPSLPGFLGGGRGFGGGRRAGGGARGGDQSNAPSAAGTTGTVYVLRQGSPVPISVTLGLDDGAHTEIVQGPLSESDQVVLSENAGNPH